MRGGSSALNASLSVCLSVDVDISGFEGRTLHMCSDWCVLVTIRLVCRWWFHNNTVLTDTPHIPCCHSGRAHSLDFLPPVPSLLCACVATDHPRQMGTHQVLGSLSVGCCYSHKAGIVDHGGFYQ